MEPSVTQHRLANGIVENNGGTCAEVPIAGFLKGWVYSFVTLSVTGCICINNASGFFLNIIVIAYS